MFYRFFTELQEVKRIEPDRVRRERLEELTRAIRQLDPEELRRLRDFVAGLEAARRKEAEDDGY